eukprot:TRINITY_DN12025_c0_g1_i1.p1 TRINITY_DN12025_c0_g1~~TRINITY_DN12025_c0_g1_i1.p1  ORF type:complete len:813 (-),score=221.78 TRINITY_DN12025_c0_g1_i1:118-2556(-)
MDVQQEIPEAFFCPITRALMVDPVMDPEGNTYERNAIEEWLTKNKVSPITRTPLQQSDLIPNRALKASIDQVRLNAKGVELDPLNIPQQLGVEMEIVDDASIVPRLSVTTKENMANISVVPPRKTKRVPCNVCCVVDVSGSMGSEATLKDNKGNTEYYGLSVLDVVKHAVKSIIENLNPEDNLSIVSFQNTAKTVLELTPMNGTGRQKALKALDSLEADGMTNLWDGLAKGLDILKSGSSAGTISSIFLLTDGEPNIVPPRGHIPMLKRYKTNNDGLPGIINTFGFGYTIDCPLLVELAGEGNGSYAYIPDSSLTGTVFVNAITNLLTTTYTNLTLTVESLNGITIQSAPGYIKQNDSSTVAFNFGSAHCGQSKDFVVQLSAVPADLGRSFIKATLKYYDVGMSTSSQTSITAEPEYKSSSESDLQVDRNYYRLKLVECLKEVLDLLVPPNHSSAYTSSSASEVKFGDGLSFKKAKELVTDLVKQLKSSSVKDDEYIKDITKDLEGQTLEAVVDKAFKRWGRFYLPSLMGAHVMQICNNFKDPGVQHYTSPLFHDIRDKVEEAFVKLPPPKPSNHKPSNLSTSTTTSTSSSRSSKANFSGFTYTPSMNVYYNAGGGCFVGTSLVHLANNQFKPASQIKKGDQVICGNGRVSTVVCVVKTLCNQLVRLVSPPGVSEDFKITEWHPIRINSEWKFPSSIGSVVEQYVDAVYDFVLDSNHSVMINGVEVVTLGHSFTGSPVIEHPYFGSYKVIEDLSSMNGWSNGLVHLRYGKSQRDEDNLLITSFVPAEDVRTTKNVTPSIQNNICLLTPLEVF